MKFTCRTRLFENLRMLPHAPGVQVQGIVFKILLISYSWEIEPSFSLVLVKLAIPEEGVKDDSEDEDTINQDERNPQSLQDKRILGENEFSDSEDEGPISSNRKDKR